MIAKAPGAVKVRPGSRIDQWLEAGRSSDALRRRVADDLGLTDRRFVAVGPEIGVLEWARPVGREAKLIAHRPATVVDHGQKQRIAGDADDRRLMPDAARPMPLPVVRTIPVMIRRGHAFFGQRLGGFHPRVVVG